MMASPSQAGTLPQRSGDRWLRRLNALFIVVLILGVLGVLSGLVVTAILGLETRQPFDYGFPSLLVSEAEISFDGALTPGTHAASVSVEVDAYNPRQAPAIAVLFLFTWLPIGATWLLALWWLVRVTGRHGNDRRLFSTETVGYLRRVGATLIIGAVASTALAMTTYAIAGHLLVTNSYLFGVFGSPYLPSLFPIVAGFAALAVAEVIRRGLAMLEDLEGTV